MGNFRVVEHFISINGEGRRAGQLAFFIRMAGCNLSCGYCDTKWANEAGVSYETYDETGLYQMIKDSGVLNVTLTGGEPLLQRDINELFTLLRQDKALRVEVETNGSVDILPFLPEDRQIQDNISFTLDYKLPVSGMEEKMFLSNYRSLRSMDTVKFVVGSRADLIRSKEIIENYGLIEKECGIYLSPCFGKIEPAEIVNFVIEHNINNINIQLQLHKYIWDPDKRGV